MKKTFLFCCMAVLGLSNLIAQDLIRFTQGLASGSAHRYGRDAVFTDTLLHTWHISGARPPAEGVVWYDENGISKKWMAVQADSSGLFRDRQLSNGYLYLTYRSDKATTAILTVTGHSMAYFNGAPHAGDNYRYGWLQIPVALKKGLNELYIRTARFGGVTARLSAAPKQMQLSRLDPTLPHLVKGDTSTMHWAGIVCLNNSSKNRQQLTVTATAAGRSITTALPPVMPMSSRKIPVQLPVPSSLQGSSTAYLLTLSEGGKTIDTLTIALQHAEAGQHQSHTFISDIDGSVQYYAVAPQAGGPGASPALYFSVHGAEVEAISQARAYKPKAEGPVVAPTNRRPRGFNWEDWGRLDALEVLSIARKQYQPDPQRIYLTGHSMGGHGTWYLGTSLAGQWAAIAPCAGYPTLATYGSADGLIALESSSPVRRQVLRASSHSNILPMVQNLAVGGVYIFHGDSDRTVSVDYARQMRRELAAFHPNFTYKEYPGGSHWFGDISVDWPPLFEYLNLHRIPLSSSVNRIDFSTASPAISSQHFWTAVLQQEKSLQYSRVQLQRDSAGRRITGTTSNILSFSITPEIFPAGTNINITIDQQPLSLTLADPRQPVYLQKQNGRWQLAAAPAAGEKGPLRNGGFKSAFQHRMVFVYGTKGSAEENTWALEKARYDAETWYYRGNGAVDVISDAQFTEQQYPNTGVVLYGNAQTNSAYPLLLAGCPVSIGAGLARIGSKEYRSGDIGAYFVWPRKGSNHASIAVIGGTGIKGMRAAESNQYFTGGSGFPDFLFFNASLFMQGEKGLQAAGYFNTDWTLGSDWTEQ